MFSVCIITRDEAPKLKRCLEAVRMYLSGADYEIVVVDTGSSDDSEAVAHEYTSSVYSFEWCDDFAAAKNYSIEKASSDHILLLDTDEYIENVDIEGLVAFFESSPKAMGLINRRNAFRFGNEDRYSTEWIPRAFNRRYYRFEGRIHEQLRAVGNESGGSIVRVKVPATIEHDGYMLSKEDIQRKSARNIELLKKELADLRTTGDEEKIPYTLFQLGKSYYYAGDYKSAADYYGEALGYDLDEHLEYVIDMVSSYGYALINSGQEEMAQDLEGVYDAFSHDADYLFVMGLIYMKNARFDDAIRMFEEATKRPEARIEGVNGYLARYNTGVIYECLGDISHAKEYYRQCRDYASAAARLDELDKQSKTKYTVAFLPYKAAMWDSMESIYLACKEDDEIQTIVMPIPYFSVDENTGKAAEHIDMSFPEDVLITDYHKVDLAKMHPDAIFIHNPYDGANNVTSVHPDYYSDKLKDYTDNLIYVPYYASPWGLSADMSVLPAYRNVDYWIVPSVRFKEEAKANPFYEKIVPLGSPKYDKVIRLSERRPDCPSEWGELPEGKPRILICSTIASVLSYTDKYIDIYEELFERLAKRDDITVIWRPHPLLTSTIRTLRAGSYDRWCELETLYKEKDVGIIDRTGDVSLAIACTDAEIDDGSSIVSLYMAAGKPAVTFFGADTRVDDIIAFVNRVADGDTKDIIDRNKERITPWAEYLDGSSGDHIYEWLKGLLEKGDK